MVNEGKDKSALNQVTLPYPIEKAADLLGWSEQAGLKISEVVIQNEWHGGGK